MTDEIKAGSILIEPGARLPASLRFESEQCSSGWRSVKAPDRDRLDRQIRDAGWSFFYLAGEVKASVFGRGTEETTRKAIQRILGNLKSEKFNCLEITQVAFKRFLGIPYVSVSAHWRHIQESMFLCRRQRLEEWDRAKLDLARAGT